MKKSLLFLIAWMTLFCAAAQKAPQTPTHYLDDPYYFFSVFSTGDSLAYTRGNASVVKNRVVPRNYEEEKCAAFANGFSVSMGGLCGHFNYDTDNKVIQLTIRCISDQDFLLFPHKPTPQEIDSNWCLPPCDDLFIPMGGDSVLCVVDKVMKNVRVYQLKVKGRKAYIDTFLGQTDECGAFRLEIPSDRDSYYGFCVTDDHIEWVHFFGDLSSKAQQKLK